MENDGKKRKFLNGMADALQMATDLSKKAVDGLQKGAKALSEKSQNDGYERRMKKYNPLFPKDMEADIYKLPSIIHVVDEIVRRDVDVCEGAIGWSSVEKENEVLHIYEEEVERCGVQFIPYMERNSVYYADRFNSKRYIKVDCIFKMAVDEKIAELKHIAGMLGAKRCSVEIEERCAEEKKSSLAFGVGLGKISAAGEQSNLRAASNLRRGLTKAEWEGNDTPKRPKLKWFMYDDNILHLIEERCKDRNPIKSQILELEGASSATMSQTTASAIDCILGKSILKTSLNLEEQAEKEQHSKLFFEIEF